jgi:hypothetical protein
LVQSLILHAENDFAAGCTTVAVEVAKNGPIHPERRTGGSQKVLQARRTAQPRKPRPSIQIELALSFPKKSDARPILNAIPEHLPLP